MLVHQLKELLSKLPAECDNLPICNATNNHGERKIELIVHSGILPVPGNPVVVLIDKSEYDRMVTEGKAPTYPDYTPPGKDDILPGDEWKLG